MLCVYCGKEIPNDMSYCGYCGYNQNPQGIAFHEPVQPAQYTPPQNSLPPQTGQQKGLSAFEYKMSGGNNISFVFITYVVFAVIMLIQAVMALRLLRDYIEMMISLDAQLFCDFAIVNAILTYAILVGTIIGMLTAGRAKYAKDLEKQATHAYYTYACSVVLLVLNSIFTFFELIMFFGLLYFANAAGVGVASFIFIVNLIVCVAFTSLGVVLVKKSDAYKKFLKDFWFSINSPTSL